MPICRPIPAIRYADDRTDLSSCIAPPYDVLDELPKQALLANDQHNIVAVDLPVTPPKTVGPDTAYRQAADTLNQWLDQRILIRDDTPAYYAYEQVYEIDGMTRRRRGLFARIKTEPFGRVGGGIHRHEKTIQGGLDDRMKLMLATRCQLSPVFSVYDDADGGIAELLQCFDQSPPQMTGTTANDQVAHRLWRLTDQQLIASLSAAFEHKDLFIADGHHRYTTALSYSQDHSNAPDAGYCMMVLVALQDPGMIVLPTHRIVTGLADFSIPQLIEAANAHGLSMTPAGSGVHRLADLESKLPDAGPHAMGLMDPSTEELWIIGYPADPLAPTHPQMPEVWRQLDVAIVQHMLIEQVLGPTFGGVEPKVKYAAEMPQAVDLARAESAPLIVMQATPLSSVCQVSRAGEVMPAKSTYFYPKLATGLVINPLY